MKKSSVASAIPLLLLTSCAVGPDYKKPTTETPGQMPSLLSGALETTDVIDPYWWKMFSDPQLDALVKTSLENNLDLVVALARVDEARANLGISKSSFYPNIDLNGSAERQKVSETLGIPVDSSISKFNNYGLSVDLSYELDLWGKIRRSTEAARADLFQADYNRANVQLTLVSQVVSNYFLLRSLDLQLAIAKDTAKSRKESFELIDKRFRGGLTSELNARQAESELHSAEASAAQFENLVSRAESSLSILLGRSPREIIDSPMPRGKSLRELIVPPSLPMVLPSKLLERRPDIAAAEQELVAQNARIGVAKSNYFPSISLIGGIGTESNDMKNLFKGPSNTWSYGLNLSLPIFNGGRTGYLVEAATARQKAALAQYQKSIQVAFGEVRDALKAYDSGKYIVDAQRAQVTAVERNLYLANLRYKNGQSPYLDVLDAERQLFQVQLALVQSQQDRLISVVDLYKALGGGWMPNKQEAKK